MKRSTNYLCFVSLLILFSCQNKTQQLLQKKWDCTQVENLNLNTTKFQSVEDSVANTAIEQSLKQLSWTFTKPNIYQCKVGNAVSTEGTYQLNENDKLLLCTSSKNITVNYNILSLTETELTLSANSNEVNITLHFKPQ
jgi:hypothetical protein